VKQSDTAKPLDKDVTPGTFRAGIGQSIAIIVLVLALMLFVLLFS
jgi:hypothetical protein